MILRYSADWRSLLTIIFTLTTAMIVWTGIIDPLWLQVLLWMLSTGLMYICFAINHNHQHVHMSQHRSLNLIIDLALGLCQGLPAPVVIYAHNMDHHTHADSPQDAMWTGHVQTRHHLLRLLYYPFVSASRYFLIRRTIAGEVARRNPIFARKISLQRRWLVSVTVLLFIIHPLNTLLVFIFPWMMVHLWGLNSNFMQHEGCSYQDPHDHSRNYVGPILNWMLFNGGYHTIHHERPGLHWSRMPAEHAKRASAISPHLNVRNWNTWMIYYMINPQKALYGENNRTRDL